MVTTTRPKLNIIIAGAGLGGLGAAIGLAKSGHKVIVLEQAHALNEVGAGIQIPPNSVRVLEAYGLMDKFLAAVTWPANIQLRRYATGEVLGKTPLHPTLTEQYGYPYWLIHRADYQKILFDAAVEAGADIRMSTGIDSVDQAKATVTLANGNVLTADLIIGADGIRSKVRDTAVVTEELVRPNPGTNCAFRATIPAAEMLADPVIAHLMTDVNSNCWIGYRRHVMAYPIRNGELYNIVMSHPGQASPGRWNEPGDIEEMKNHYKNWDPVVVQLLTKIKTVLKWVLADMPTLPRWVSESGKVVLIGDAAHATLPYLAQGASMAIEDGACLTNILENIESVADIPAAMLQYQSRRKRRCEKIQAGSRANGYIWHMPDGEEQEERDALMKETANESKEVDTKAAKKANPNQWSDANFQPWLFGWNAFTD